MHSSKENLHLDKDAEQAEFGLDLLFCHVHLQLLQLVSLGSETMRKSAKAFGGLG